MVEGLHALGALGKKRVGRETIPLIRLHIVVEGQTEEVFINEVLAPELGAQGIFVDAHRITTGRKHGRPYRGGWDSYTKLRRDLILWMKQDQNAEARFTTMVDLYGLPDDFPGYESCRTSTDSRRRVECLEEHFSRDITVEFGGDATLQRFVPYIQLHEFEALVFCDPVKFLVAFPDQAAAVDQLLGIRAECGGPEDINDGETSAPSKRITQILPEYVKTVSGLLIVKQIGLAKLRQDCPHFAQWINKLLQFMPPHT